MSNERLARRAKAKVLFAGTDISKDIADYLLELAYLDAGEGEADDLTIKLQDRDGLWMLHWLEEAVDKASGGGLTIQADIIRENEKSDGKDARLPCGSFELDCVQASGPPSVVTIKANALAWSGSMRETKKTRVWQGMSLSGIAKQLAAENGMQCRFDSAFDPVYKRKDQRETSDAAFLQRLCKDAGLIFKVTDGEIVLFDERIYEAKPVSLILKKGGGRYLKYDLKSGSAGTKYASCRVRCVDPSTGQCIEGIARASDYNAESENNRQLEIHEKADSPGEAKTLAEKYLRLHNKYARTAVFTLPGNPWIAVGQTVQIDGWGGFSGKYFICQARHSLSQSGYTTEITMRKCLKGY